MQLLCGISKTINKVEI